jgi:hypothetical protein
MATLKQKMEQNAKDGRMLDRLIVLQARGNIAPVVAGNACPRKTTCMCELTMLRMYEGRGRTLFVPAGCNPFAS